KGYVERRPNPNDRRKFELHLTTAGNELVEQVMPLIFGIRSRGVQGIETADLEAAKRVLNAIFRNFD
ncbi:MAG: MarR family transcriptional regulator, partial [Bacteroidota bacterium]